MDIRRWWNANRDLFFTHNTSTERAKRLQRRTWMVIIIFGVLVAIIVLPPWPWTRVDTQDAGSPEPTVQQVEVEAPKLPLAPAGIQEQFDKAWEDWYNSGGKEVLEQMEDWERELFITQLQTQFLKSGILN